MAGEPDRPSESSRSQRGAMARIAITLAAGVAVAVAAYLIGAYVFRPPPETFHSGARSGWLPAEHSVLA